MLSNKITYFILTRFCSRGSCIVVESLSKEAKSALWDPVSVDLWHPAAVSSVTVPADKGPTPPGTATKPLVVPVTPHPVWPAEAGWDACLRLWEMTVGVDNNPDVS